MRAINSAEREILIDAAEPALDQDTLDWIYEYGDLAGECNLSAEQEDAVESLLLRRCIVVSQRIVDRFGDEWIFYGLTELGRIALTLTAV